MKEKVISLAQDLIRRPSISPNDGLPANDC